MNREDQADYLREDFETWLKTYALEWYSNAYIFHNAPDLHYYLHMEKIY